MADAVKEAEPKEEEPKEVEDTTPRDVFSGETQTVKEKPTPGWQVPPLAAEELEISCPHIGRIVASLQSALYPLGAEWVCTCGQIFVVAVNKGGKRTLRKQEDVAEDGLNAETPDEPVGV